MKIITSVCCAMLSAAAMQAQIIHVPGDYPTIQQAIDTAKTGDTVLVSPGTYTENLSIEGKSITLASLFLLTQDPSYITGTILDGNHAGPVVRMESCIAPEASMCGFTIINGAYCGILCRDANPSLKNLIVKNSSTSYCGGGIGIIRTNESITEPTLLEDLTVMGNSAEYCGGGIGVVNNDGSPPAVVLKNVLISGNTASSSGGGFYIDLATAVMENVTITGNCASSGGGLASSNACTLTFDTINRCNIHSNMAMSGSDLTLDWTLNDVLIAVDTFSVLHPTAFHATSWWSPLSFDIIHGKHEQYNADLYVSPSGNNANSGLTAGEPLKTIHSAFSYMLADSLDPHCVHLLEGTYSPNTNGEHFPLRPPEYIDLIGLSDSSVILDADSTASVLMLETNYPNVIAGITVSGGADCGIVCFCSDPVLKDLTISHNWGSGLECYESNPVLENVHIMHNTSTYAGGGINCYSSSPRLSNVTINENTAGHGGGMYISNNSLPVFDTINRCSIYLNSALNSYTGHDLVIDYTPIPLQVSLDTFTVIHPKAYHASPLERFSFNILHGKTSQYAGDLYISPQGNDHNTGFTADDPLKTILYAFSKILADSLHPCSIRLAPGTYGPSATGELFPIKMENYITLKGASPDSVILDGERKYQIAEASNIQGTGLENLSVIHGFKRGKGGGVVCINAGMEMDNVSLTGNSASGYWAGRPLPTFYPGRGGGLYCVASEVFLRNVTFTDDTACYGGGLYVSDSRLGLQAVTLKNNTARIGGGGVYASVSSFSFDTLHRPSIYGNFAHDGNDLYSDTLLHIVADTFSVKYPTDFYTTPVTHFTFDIRHGLQEQVDADLYVSPAGNDGNSGLTQDIPLKTMNAAFRRIRADNTSSHVIRLLDGTYSPSGTGEPFPVNIPDFLRVERAGDSAVILDADGKTGAIEIMENTITGLSGLTVTGGSEDTGGGIYCLNSNAVIHGVSVTDNQGIDGGGIGCVNSNLQLTGSRIAGNLAAGFVSAGGPGSRSAYGGGLYCDHSMVQVSNTLFFGDSASKGYGGAVSVSWDSFLRLENVTITANVSDRDGGGIYCPGNIGPIVMNTIIWNNDPQGIDGYAEVTWSDIQGGWPGEGNISDNPQFYGHGKHPFMITAASACRNTGTPDTTGLFLPPTDLAGGPRIWDGRIDMGAYEWNNVGFDDLRLTINDLRLTNFPNPFTGSVTFTYTLYEASQVTLQIFDSFGRVVEEPVNGTQAFGDHQVQWDSRDLPAGMYYYRIQAGSKMVSGKMVKN